MKYIRAFDNLIIVHEIKKNKKWTKTVEFLACIRTAAHTCNETCIIEVQLNWAKTLRHGMHTSKLAHLTAVDRVYTSATESSITSNYARRRAILAVSIAAASAQARPHTHTHVREYICMCKVAAPFHSSSQHINSSDALIFFFFFSHFFFSSYFLSLSTPLNIRHFLELKTLSLIHACFFN